MTEVVQGLLKLTVIAERLGEAGKESLAAIQEVTAAYSREQEAVMERLTAIQEVSAAYTCEEEAIKAKWSKAFIEEDPRAIFEREALVKMRIREPMQQWRISLDHEPTDREYALQLLRTRLAVRRELHVDTRIDSTSRSDSVVASLVDMKRLPKILGRPHL
ncbi:hypothetical protein LTR95_006471 [Oleoguttula sp. CCFEE 5521]